MKKIFLLSAMAAMLLTGCNEDSFLEEKPLDFNSASNSYSTNADFEASVTELYYLVRDQYYATYDRTTTLMSYADMWITADPLKSNLDADLSPTGAIAQFYWDKNYLLIAQANTILSRLPKSTVDASGRTLFEAQARFFRALGYRTLVYLYGDVPLQTEEVTSPKTDYVRTPKEQVLQQCIADLVIAVNGLPDIDKVRDGEISKPAAQMLLAEVYLAVGNNGEALTTCNQIIGNPKLGLMKQRFGSEKNDSEADVFYDLFRPNNQNRSCGNTEGIWVIQFETNVEGGGNNTSHFFWNPGSFWGERFFAPQVDKFQIHDPNGNSIGIFNWPIGDFTGGRGIGTHYAVDHLDKEIWNGDDGDIRNSNYNWPRRYKVHRTAVLDANPDLKNAMPDGYFDIDKTVGLLPPGYTIEAGFAGGTNAPTKMPNRFMCGYSTKMTTPFHHPDAQYQDKNTYTLAGTGGKTYTDQYFFRLAEAYLLRAEANVKLNQMDAAANDINELRNRAHGQTVAKEDMSLDFILDERLRELTCEEKRRLTLARTGKLAERIQKYNPYFKAANSSNGKDYDAHFDLFPIPVSAIQANKDAELKQNPGY